MKLKPYSALSLSIAGILLLGTGIYFIFLRPALLPEDLRFMKSTLPEIQETIPGLALWLKNVFWVMGGYILTTGLLTIYISRTSFRTHEQGSFWIVALTGLSSIGFMTLVNFMLGSDFKWRLLLFTFPWGCALILYRLNK